MFAVLSHDFGEHLKHQGGEKKVEKGKKKINTNEACWGRRARSRSPAAVRVKPLGIVTRMAAGMMSLGPGVMSLGPGMMSLGPGMMSLGQV